MAAKDNDIVVSWDPPQSPTNVASVYVDVASYEIQHKIANFDSPLEVEGTATSYTFKDVAPGTYQIAVRVVNVFGKVSPYLSRTVTVGDIDNVPRTILNIPTGGTLNVGLYLELTTAGLVKLGSDDYTYLPAGEGVEPVTIVNGSSSQTQQQFSMSNGEQAFLYFDYSGAAGDPLKAVEYFTYGTSGVEWIKEITNSSGVAAISGTVAVPAKSNLVTGTNTSFTSNYKVGEYILIGTTFGARIAEITSDTKMEISTSSPAAISGGTAYKFALDIDYKFDSLMAR